MLILLLNSVFNSAVQYFSSVLLYSSRPSFEMKSLWGKIILFILKYFFFGAERFPFIHICCLWCQILSVGWNLEYLVVNIEYYKTDSFQECNRRLIFTKSWSSVKEKLWSHVLYHTVTWLLRVMTVMNVSENPLSELNILLRMFHTMFYIFLLKNWKLGRICEITIFLSYCS